MVDSRCGWARRDTRLKLRLLFTGVASLVGSDALGVLRVATEDDSGVPGGACVVTPTLESLLIGVLRTAQSAEGNASSCTYAANLTVGL